VKRVPSLALRANVTSDTPRFFFKVYHYQRMRGWLASNWRAVVVEMDSEAVGYLLFQFRTDEYRPSDSTVYVRQFFIGRNYRSRGIGRQAFSMIRERFFPKVSSVVLEVLEANAQARRFWISLGFKPYCTTMKLNSF
jgi:ribosomal protein S18 acetylase RimI-like enzyme